MCKNTIKTKGCKKMAYDQKRRLVDRIEGNYCSFMASLRGVSREKLFEIAGRISAVTEAYEMLTKNYEWDEDGEIEFYLLFRDPLTIVADAWEIRRDENLNDFCDAMFEVGSDDRTISQYPLIEGVADNIDFNFDPDDETIRFLSGI